MKQLLFTVEHIFQCLTPRPLSDAVVDLEARLNHNDVD